MRLYGLQKQREEADRGIDTDGGALSATRGQHMSEGKSSHRLWQVWRTGQILDVPVPPVMEQLRKVPKMVSHDRIQPWTAERIVDVPVPTVSEEHVDITKVSS